MTTSPATTTPWREQGYDQGCGARLGAAAAIGVLVVIFLIVETDECAIGVGAAAVTAGGAGGAFVDVDTASTVVLVTRIADAGEGPGAVVAGGMVAAGVVGALVEDTDGRVHWLGELPDQERVLGATPRA